MWYRGSGRGLTIKVFEQDVHGEVNLEPVQQCQGQTEKGAIFGQRRYFKLGRALICKFWTCHSLGCSKRK